MVKDLEAQQGAADLSLRTLGENFASLFMLSQQAVANHLETSPEVIRQLAIDRTQILSNAEFARLKTEAKPTPEQIKAYYTAHLADYDVVQLRRLFIWKVGEGSSHKEGLTPADAKALAQAIQQAYATGGDPRKLIHDSNTVVLDAEPITFLRGELPPKMDEAAFSMTKDGEWLEFENTPDALVYFQLVKRDRRDLKEVSQSIEKTLLAQKLRAELDDLKKQSGIWLDPQYFGNAKPESTKSEASGQGSSFERGER
jgi:hypothetical protein